MLGQRLKELRGSRTQDEIAEKLEIPRARYSHYENERNKPEPEMLIKMALLFDTSIDYLLGLTEERFPTYRTAAHDDRAREDREFVQIFMNLSPEKKQALVHLVKTFAC